MAGARATAVAVAILFRERVECVERCLRGLLLI